MLNKINLTLVSLLLSTLIFSTTTLATDIKTENTTVKLTTNQGDIIIELFDKEAPLSTKNFITYVEEGFYNDVIFHRVMPGFMIQGGGFTTDYHKKDVHSPIKNEADNGLKNDRGTLAMARTGNPHSATAQFFINHTDNTPLNYRSKTRSGWGYAVFGKVTDGMDIVDKIAATPTGNGGKFLIHQLGEAKFITRPNVPKKAIVIEKAEVIK